MGGKSSKEAAQRQFGDKGGMPSKFKWSHSCQTSQKYPRLRGLRKWFLCMWGSLALKPDTNSYFFRQGLLLRDKMTIFTDSKHVL
jgi:hypothetical protein